MHTYMYILLYFLLKHETLSKQIEIKCPEHCKCDIFEKLKRASCINRNLATVESYIPHQTALLDLSYNQITHLNDHVFMDEKLLSLKLLNVSHNKIGQIHINAFEGLNQLKTLDLSFNGIQYILNNWFKSLESLEELYLRGNGFSRLKNEIVFESKTLKRLDLSSCQISHIENDAFSRIPNLEILDVSDNYLIHVDVAIIKPLPNLNILNVKKNHLSCDGVSVKLIEYCKSNGVRVENPCKIQVLESGMFQRMVNMPPDPESEKNSWIYDDEEETINYNKTETIQTCNSTHVDKSLLQEIVDLSPISSIVIPFIYGIAVGVLTAYIIHTFREEKRKDVKTSTYFNFDDENSNLHRTRNRFSRISRYSADNRTEERQNLTLREVQLSDSTPVLFRKNQNQINF